MARRGYGQAGRRQTVGNRLWTHTGRLAGDEPLVVSSVSCLVRLAHAGNVCRGRAERLLCYSSSCAASDIVETDDVCVPNWLHPQGERRTDSTQTASGGSKPKRGATVFP